MPPKQNFLFRQAKKLLVPVIAALLIAGGSQAKAGQAAPPPQVTAPSAILMDASDGRVLWEKGARERRPIASTTKIMTAILVMENLRSDDLVITSQRASEAGESELYLTPGEQRKVGELLYGLMLRSANDAAIVLAEKVAGSVEGFASLMNEKARGLGAIDTNFSNPHGLKDGNHYSTAYDLALITRYALKNKRFADLVKTKSFVMDWPGNPFPRVCENHNRLLEMLPWATGVKTGYTKEAGYCLVGSAEKEGLKLIAVVLGAGSGDATFDETKAVLEWGFSNFERRQLVTRGTSYGTFSHPDSPDKTQLISTGGLAATVLKSSPALEKKIVLRKGLSLPLIRGQSLGKLVYREGARPLGEVSLIAMKGISRPSLWRRLKIFLRSLW
jgi:D-alanyl-D-alanine carboxypeptidase (penicillin-binding protein 5/6)